jgi:hypothetical protein
VKAERLVALGATDLGGRMLLHMSHGDGWDADVPGVGRHPVVVVTRDLTIPGLSSVVCLLVTSTFHGLVAEVVLGAGEGLGRSNAADCDQVFMSSDLASGSPRPSDGAGGISPWVGRCRCDGRWPQR